jgi:hypothetical protein
MQKEKSSMNGHASRSALLVVITGAIALSLTMAAPAPARAGGVSYVGTFTVDNEVQLEFFTVTTTSDVTIETWSYSGGTNFAGQTIPAGGLDPIVTLFNSSGSLLGFNDDINTQAGQLDSLLSVQGLVPGTYTVALTQFDNYATGPNLSDGFNKGGAANSNFTLTFAPKGLTGFFWNYQGIERTGNWAMDIVTTASVPEPSSLLLGGIGTLAGVGLVWKRRTRPAA